LDLSPSRGMKSGWSITKPPTSFAAGFHAGAALHLQN
jgi:hypothetical protein